MGGMYLTNWSLTYLNYPTRVVFKSSKVVRNSLLLSSPPHKKKKQKTNKKIANKKKKKKTQIPVMIVGVFLQKRFYSRTEYLNACVLVLGIVLFTLGDAKESPKFDIRGVALVSGGVLFDAITSNFEEKRFFVRSSLFFRRRRRRRRPKRRNRRNEKFHDTHPFRFFGSDRNSAVKPR
jgi:adenosine 3'-phospho 5'-phosphosulfate transporter B3